MNIVKGFVEQVGRSCSAVHFRFVFILSVVVVLAKLTFSHGSGVTVVLIVINNVFRCGQGRSVLRCRALDVARQT